MRLIFYHGWDGHSDGDKPTALRRQFSQLESPDLRGMSVDERMRFAANDIADKNEPCYLIGSSFGGAMAAVMASYQSNLVHGYLLCAPAFHMIEGDWEHEVDEYAVTPQHAQILLAAGDSSELNQNARKFATRFNIPVTTVIGGHRMERHTELIVRMALEGWSKVN